MRLRLRPRLLVLAFALCAAVPAFASKTVLPDACGDDKVKFDVDVKKDSPAPAGPAEGKALIVFVETLNLPSRTVAILGGGPQVQNYMTRFALDGAWVGATKANSFFTLEVTPGEHHLCSSVKGDKDLIGMLTLTAEAGHTYYVEYKILPNTTRIQGSQGTQSVHGYATSPTGGLSLLDADAGRFRVKASGLSAWKAKD